MIPDARFRVMQEDIRSSATNAQLSLLRRSISLRYTKMRYTIAEGIHEGSRIRFKRSKNSKLGTLTGVVVKKNNKTVHVKITETEHGDSLKPGSVVAVDYLLIH